ncbi:MAG: hypothetical protein M4579_004142 [Chaenotheca gracillima]|nr:MAG: hypothetical protein M4579_004142 [Chaenotheca gracillima]
MDHSMTDSPTAGSTFRNLYEPSADNTTYGPRNILLPPPLNETSHLQHLVRNSSHSFVMGSPFGDSTRYPPGEWDGRSTDMYGSSSEAYPPSSYLMDPHVHHPYLFHVHHGMNGGNGLSESQYNFGPRFPTQPSLPPDSFGSPLGSLPASFPSTQIRQSGDTGLRSPVAPDSLLDSPVMNSMSDTEENEPYAKLIYRALMSVPEHKMVLKEIYDWFIAHTDKNKNPSEKGWQNSIRHNLSMNGAFRKVEQEPSSDDTKKGFIWVLEPDAVEDGVKSTTRYRKLGVNKRARKSATPAVQRQASGRKGGRAAKRGQRAGVRKPESFEPRTALHSIERAYTSYDAPPVTPLGEDLSPGRDLDAPYYGMALTPTTPQSLREPSSCMLQDVIGVSGDYANEPLFCGEDEPGSIDSADFLHIPSSASGELFCSNLGISLRGPAQKTH